MSEEIGHPVIIIQKQFTASFDVDCQKGFTPLCPHELPVPDGHNIVSELNVNAFWAKYRIGSKDCHPSNPVWLTTDVELVAKPTGISSAPEYWPSHCVVGTDGNELIPGLPPVSTYDFFVFKGSERNLHPYGACYHDVAEQISTGVIEWLKSRGITNVIVGGLATDYCVKTTAIQLAKAGFFVILNLAACRGISKESTEKALFEMESLHGVVVIQDSTYITLSQK